MNQTGSTVQSLDRVFDIVETLSNHGNELSISQLCAFTGLNKSTVHRMLASLRARGYVVQTSSGAYRLTFKFCSLSQKIINNVSILPLVLPHLRKLSMSVQEIVHFVIQDNTNTVYLDRLEPPNSNYRSTVNIGMLRPLHTSAGGKIILSSQGPEAWRSYWDNADKTPITPYTITSFERLESEMLIFQRKQYAVENEENTLGYSCIAVSLYDRYNDDHYAITLSSLKSLMTDEHIQQLFRPDGLRIPDRQDRRATSILLCPRKELRRQAKTGVRPGGALRKDGLHGQALLRKLLQHREYLQKCTIGAADSEPHPCFCQRHGSASCKI